jgi:hypothetical protein
MTHSGRFSDQDGGRVYSGDCIRNGRPSRCQLLRLSRLPFYPIGACNFCALPGLSRWERSPAGASHDAAGRRFAFLGGPDTANRHDTAALQDRISS